MTRSRPSDQRRSLALHRTTISFAPPRRFIPAHKENVTMKKLVLTAGALGLLGLMTFTPVPPVAHAQGGRSMDFVAPLVFQAAGPTADSIQSTVDAYRAALGEPNNGIGPNNLDPSGEPIGRREINWDGGGANVDDDSPGHAVQHLPERARRPVHHTGDGPLAGSPIGRAPGRPGHALQQSDLRHDLQHLQPLAPVHPGGQQHHRGAVLRARLQWERAGNGHVASARSSQTLTSRTGADPARSKETARPAR